MPSMHIDTGMHILSPEQIEHVSGGSSPAIEIPTGPLPYNPFPDILIK